MNKTAKAPARREMKEGRASSARSLAPDLPEGLDPEGWMGERPTYWLEQPWVEAPTPAAWLRHRAREFATWLHLAESKRERQPSQEEWIAASEQALGPLPHPPRKRGAKSRPADSAAREAPKKPAARSQPLPRAG